MPTPAELAMSHLQNATDEATPLLQQQPRTEESRTTATTTLRRQALFDFLEAKTSRGKIYESFMMVLILVNVAAFILASLFVEDYNGDQKWASRKHGICQNACDALWFGNYADNGLEFLGLGPTSILEIVTVVIFTIDYLLRVYTADLLDENYRGIWGRIKFLPSFFSLVDLASTVPFYIDAFVLRHSELFASQFLRMFRLFRMMRVEGRYDTALTMFDDVYRNQRGILGTALFVGVTTWITVSALYYLVERRNTDMIYCGAAPDYCGPGDEMDVSLCTIDVWGFTDCSAAGCPSTPEYPEPCYNLFQSIPMASYYALLNLFGEFPLIDQHNVGGKIVGTLTAVVAVAVFALPAGIIGNGFEDLIEERRERERGAMSHHHHNNNNSSNNDAAPPPLEGGMTPNHVGDSATRRGRMYNFLHQQTSRGSVTFDLFINALIVGTALTFMLDTVHRVGPAAHLAMDSFEFVAVCIFTVEYAARVYASREDPKYSGPGGQLRYMGTFLPMVDFMTVAPYWLYVMWTGQIVSASADTSDVFGTVVKCLRLLRLLRFERYTHAFTSFDDVIRRNVDVLAVTGYTALLFWVFFGAILYFTERDNPDPEMASNYNTVPNSMWVTLLNLSGESPLSQYSLWGKIITGILGLFATGLFGIPIGVLGAGFEEIVEEETEDTPDEVQARATADEIPGSPIEQNAYRFVNGLGNSPSVVFELTIYGLILLSVGVGIWQTVEGQEGSLHVVEWVAVLVFTIEYLIRFIGAGADPSFRKGRNGLTSRLRYVVSFYSIIDLLAILPFYLAYAMPNSWVNEYDEYLRMFRLLRLIKLDKYIPSFTLIDDVIRLKKNALIVAGYAAATLWIIFTGVMFLTEHNDHVNEIDNVPLYGCNSDCTMADRFQNYFDSAIYTGVHLTGDFPIITYTWAARFLCFFMVISAVGVMAVPSGLIANGFVSIVQSKHKVKAGIPAGGRAGDDWYEISRRALEDQDPPPSRFGPTIDRMQFAVNTFLNGTEDGHGVTHWTPFSKTGRIFIFTVIIANIVAVLAETIPKVDRAVGNESGNFFDVFEAFSVSVFLVEYALRLFSAPKNRDALYSTITYATTFFGIVDFLSTAPWFIEKGLILAGLLDERGDSIKIFRIFRIFRILQLEDFVVAFSKLDNVFRASKDVLKATGLMALIIWVGCGALFFIFEQNNPNWRSCDLSIPLSSDNPKAPGCYDFNSTADCNDFYPGLCTQRAFTNMPNALYYVAVFLGGEWGLIDFSWPGRFVCLFLCVAGIAIYAIPIGTLFDSFGAVLGMGGDEEDEDDEEEEEGDDVNDSKTGGGKD